MGNRYFFFSIFAAILLPACSGDKGDANSPPQMTSGNFVEIDENTKAVFFTVQAHDADGDAVRFELTGQDAAKFVLDGQTGALRFVQPPNFEAPEDADKDNRYELTVIASDTHGSQSSQSLAVQVNNVAFAYEVLSPLPNTVLELERYSRLPIALWVEYDYPEKFQVIVDGEIMNPASQSRMTWTGSITLETGGTEMEVEMVFWRGEEVLERKRIPIRHKHVISDHAYLIYDGMNDQIIIPHPQRLEALTINPNTGASQKRYPWVGQAPQIRDFAFDPTTGSSLYTTTDSSNSLFRLGSALESVFPIRENLDSAVLRQQVGSLAFDALSNSLFAAAPGQYAQVDVMTGGVQDFSYASSLPTAHAIQLAYDDMDRRLFLAPQNGTGVEVLTPGETSTTASFSLPGKRIGHLVYNNNLLYFAGSESHQLTTLDLATGNHSVVSGETAGAGPTLFAPTTLELDRSRGRLLTTSGARLLAVDPHNGNRSILFDSSAGTGVSSNGFTGVWVASDGARAIALGREPGRLIDIHLRTGVKTARTYQWTQTDGASYVVVNSRFNATGTYAVVRYRRANSTATDQDVLDLVSLNDGSSKRLTDSATTSHIVDSRFSREDDQLILLRREADNYSLQFLAPQNGTVTEKRQLNVPPDYSPIALRRVGHRIYVLGRQQSDSNAEFHLSVLNDNQQLATVFRVADSGSRSNDGAGIDTLFDDSILAISLPDQLPRFWHIEKAEEQEMNFSAFHGIDQPKDFYSIEDFDELYYMRTNAGLHICWRFYCAILAN